MVGGGRSVASLLALMVVPLSFGAGVVGCGGDDGPSAAPGPGPSLPTVDLRADGNRDGVVRFDDAADDTDEETWTGQHGAIFLANIDDDEDRCGATDAEGDVLSDDDLVLCNDAADTVVNGADDEKDLAPLRVAPWTDAPDDATATVRLATGQEQRARLFIRRNERFEYLPADATITAEELRAGVVLALEGIDILRDDHSWDGFVDVTYTLSAGTRDGKAVEGGTDTVRLRIAPVLSHHHLETAQQVFVTDDSSSISQKFQSALGDAVDAAAVPEGLSTFATDDIWAQDFVEFAYMSMPAEGGPHVIRVALRSANIFSNSKTLPLRRAGRVAFTRFRTKDFAGVQQYDASSSEDMDSLNSTGNFETIPPYVNGDNRHPFGRILRGSIPSFHPDKSFAAMLDAQKVQAPLLVDTSWLLVGHVDETMSFVKANTPRGWKLLINDATMARKMLEDARDAGHGELTMFDGKRWPTDKGTRDATITIADVLNDKDVMETSAEAAAEVDAQLELVRAETGLTDDEIIRVPFLHESVSGYSIAYQPGMVNGIYLSPTHFVAPRPYGPILDGEDIFEKPLRDALAAEGIEVTYIDDWSLYHVNEGEVHCGSNATRETSAAQTWWEAL
jgi:protein-arginine deiminase